MVKNLKLILDKNDLNKIIFLFFLNCLVAVLELISIGSIPILANLAINFESFANSIEFFDLKSFLSIYSTREILIYSFGAVVAFFLLKNITLFFIIFYEQKFYKGLNYRLSKTFFNHYINSKFEFHVKNKPSELASNINNEIEYSIALINYCGLLFRDLLVVIVLTGLLLYINFQVTISVLVIFCVVLIVFYNLLQSNLKSKSKKNINLREEIIRLLNESFGSIKELKVYKKIKFIQKIFEQKSFEFQNNNLFFNVSNKAPRIIFEMVAIIFLLLILLYTILNNDSFENSIPLISLLVVTFVRFIPAFNSIAISLNMIRIFKPSLEKISKEIKVMSSKNDNYIDINIRPSTIDIKQKKINFNNVNFSYSENDYTIIKDLSFEIEGKNHIGIIGSTGSGKSTFVNLLLGLLRPSSGTITIDKKTNLNLLSDNFRVGYVSQNVFLFNKSIKDNILFNLNGNGNYKKNKLYEKILEITLLESFIESCNFKHDTIIGENALKISGGQKQRIAIARALINNPEILILDEATNALDYETENKIMENLSIYLKDKILIVIGHRPGSLKRCNKIYQMKEGKLTFVENYKYFNNLN